MLVYGDENLNPKVMTVVSANRLGQETTVEERKTVHMARLLTKGTGVPVNFIRFDPEKPMETVQYWETGMKNLEEISSGELKDRMVEYGLEMNEERAHKPINSKSSSPFHDWQRRHMGDAMIVTDIDLVRCDGNQPVEIIELKRSHIDIDEWKPYKKDYNNFILLSRFTKKSGLRFYIAYNRCIKEPFLDDISKLKIFEFDHCRQTYCRLLGCRTIEQFIKNTLDESE